MHAPRPERTTNEDFMNVPDEKRSPLQEIPFFHISMLRICSMHTLYLGVGQHVNANILLKLCRGRWFHATKRALADQLHAAWIKFKQWAQVGGSDLFSVFDLSKC